MNIFEYELNESIYIPKAISDELSNKNICFFDIETTGLSSKYCEVILIGLLCVEGTRVYIKQFFADHPDDEYELLTLFEKHLNKVDYVISYNGKSFDIPFLKSRLNVHSMSTKIDDIPHLDLLQLTRKHKKLLELENCKLKTVEKALNIYREDTISGKESVALYKAYIISKDHVKRDIILKHNYDDIFYLPKLLYLYDIIEKKSTFSVDTRFKETHLRLNIDKNSIQFEKSMVSVTGRSQVIDIPSQVHYKDLYSLNWITSKGEFDIQLFFKTGSLSDGSKCLYLSLLDIDISSNDFDNLSYNIPSNIVLIKIDDQVLYDNISLLSAKIISQLD